MPYPVSVYSRTAATSNGAPHSRNAAPHRSNAALRSRSNSPYQQRNAQHDNPTQLLIKQAVDHLMRQLEAGKSETLTTFLSAMAKFHRYSFANVMSIVRTRPNATHVAGIRTWNELGRFVNKGEKGIPILAPVHSHRSRKQDETDEAASEPRKAFVVGWRIVHVWDYEQTNGADLVKPATVAGDVGGCLDRLIEFTHRQGIELDAGAALVNKYGGYLVKTIGDSLMVAFRTAENALNFALEFSRRPGADILAIRAGIHVGAVEIKHNDAFGSMVDYAARVQGAAKGAEIWVSDRAHSDIGHRKAKAHLSLKWESHATELKGIPGSQLLWKLCIEGGAEGNAN